MATEDAELLFDLAADARETTDLTDQHPGVLARLKEAYAEWERRLLPPVPLDPRYR